MTPAEKPDFLKLVAAVHGLYRKDVTPFTLNLWWEALREHELEHVSAAFTAHVKDTDKGSFCPMPADVERVLRGSSMDRAAMAWSLVLEGISFPGQYRDVVFDDPAIHASIVDLGGWPKVCRDADESTLQFLRQRFLETYRMFAKRALGSYQFPARLAGDRSPDEEYERRGIPILQPVLVGNAERALLIATGNYRPTLASLEAPR